MQIEALPAQPPRRGTAVALGSFDGVHRGHQAVIHLAAEFQAKGMLPCVLSFYPHPAAVLNGAAPPALITPVLRCEAYAKAGAQAAYEVDFYSVCDMTPRQFVTEILIGKLNAKAVCCGFNFRFGKHGAGTPELLQELCGEYGLELRIAPSIVYEGSPVSSTRIRAAIENGDLSLANAMIGGPFAYDFEVVMGDRRGRTLGSPTINQEFPENFILPRFGVYAGRAWVDSQWKCAVVNFGIRPTFSLPRPRSEAYILDYSGDLYGYHIKVQLLEYLRGEMKFYGVEELKQQITADASAARKVFLQFASEEGRRLDEKN